MVNRVLEQQGRRRRLEMNSLTGKMMEKKQSFEWWDSSVCRKYITALYLNHTENIKARFT